MIEGVRGGATVDAVLARSGLLQGLPAEAVDPLVARLESVTLRAGDVIFKEGEPGDSLFIVLSGQIRLSRHLPSGEEAVLALLGPSEEFGELSVVDLAPRTETATAVTDVTLVCLRHAALRPWIGAHPEAGERLLKSLARRLWRANSAVAHVADLFFTDVPGRLARVLLQLTDKFGRRVPDGLQINRGLTVEELAKLVGASTETVSDALAEFSRRGWIRWHDDTVIVRDKDRLAHRAR